MDRSAAPRFVPVWDIGVRGFHWMLVTAVLVAMSTGLVFGRTSLAWHLGAGVAVVVLVAWRVIWGLLGPRYARFASFAYRPAAVIAHLRDMLHGRHRRHLGHNPLGAMMVFALLAALTALGLSGAISLGGMLKQGPLRAFLSYATGVQVLDLHYLMALLLLAMIGAHLGGVAFESWRGQENLVAAMLTGDKLAQFPEDAAPPARAHPRLALVLLLAVLATAAAATVALTALPGRGAPPAALDPVFAEQCGACHLAFPPSLAPKSTWNGILADLEHHFGADATLSPGQVTQIRNWLGANAADHWDNLPSHVLRLPAADGSRRITDAPGWRQRHHAIADTVFAAKPVYRRSNCIACHADAATGQFAPQDIAIPDTAAPLRAAAPP